MLPLNQARICRGLSVIHPQEPIPSTDRCRTAMKRRARNQPWLGDLVIPVGAILVICFSVGSVFLDGTNHFSAGPPSQVFKAYRKDASTVVP